MHPTTRRHTEAPSDPTTPAPGAAPRRTRSAAAFLATASAAIAVVAFGSHAQNPGYGYSGSQQGVGYGAQQPSGGGIGSDLPPGVGYNNPGGELSRADLERQALAPAYHIHAVGTTAAQAVGTGGGPPIQDGEQPGYVQAKFVTPYGNATVMHHYGPGYPPPIGMPGGATGGGGLSGGAGTVAGNPNMVNWGMTPAWTREELGNGVWFSGASGVSSGNPVPYVGSFSD